MANANKLSRAPSTISREIKRHGGLKQCRAAKVITAQAAGITGGARYGLGPEGYPRLWLHDKDITGASTHLAFAASERAIVDEFWRAALQVGGRDNGEPGIRHHYHSHYYAAYILDPDGNNIEVVCQKG